MHSVKDLIRQSQIMLEKTFKLVIMVKINKIIIGKKVIINLVKRHDSRSNTFYQIKYITSVDVTCIHYFQTGLSPFDFNSS